MKQTRHETMKNQAAIPFSRELLQKLQEMLRQKKRLPFGAASYAIHS